MCGRFSQSRPTSDLARIFEAEDLAADAGGHFNVAPTDTAAVVVQKDERRAIVPYRWGLVPHWAEDLRIGARQINARAETVATTPAFRDAFRKRRCLVPVDAFYEWRRDGKTRQPFAVRPADDRPLALAGIWSGWRDPETEQVVRTFAVVTTGPNEVMRPIHDRMPVIVPEAAWDRWLDPTLADPAELQGLLVPADEAWLEAYPISRRVNDVRNDGPDLLAPLGEAEPEATPPEAQTRLGLDG